MSNAYQEFGMGDGDGNIGKKRFERFRAKDNETYRVSFVWWPVGTDGQPNLDAKSPRFIGAKRFYIKDAGYVLDNGNPELIRLAGGTPSKQYVATVICVWPTDRTGKVDQNRMKAGEFSVHPWVFSETMYDLLKARHSGDWHFGNHDLTMKCTDANFQKLDISPCKENLFRLLASKEATAHITAEILTTVSEIVGPNAERLRSDIAREVPVDTLRSKLGITTPSLITPDSSPEIDSILDDFTT